VVRAMPQECLGAHDGLLLQVCSVCVCEQLVLAYGSVLGVGDSGVSDSQNCPSGVSVTTLCHTLLAA
jgi:hypothetical protein